MAAGCSVLETAANPYIMSMGTPDTATRRLNIAQSFNPMGSILGILVSKFFILRDISLYSVSGTYAAVGGVLVVIMLVMLLARMPEGREDGAGNQALRATFRRLVRNRRYSLGVLAQFFYVGAQIGVWSFTIRLVMQELNRTEAEAATLYLVSIIGFCASRFVYTWLMKYVRPVKLLAAGGLLSAVSALLVVLTEGWTCVASLLLVSVFMSLMFPTIYALALGSVSGEGKPAGDVKIGASGLIMAILGGALLTPLQGLVSDACGIHVSYLVPMGCFVAVLLYALMRQERVS